jgi:tetratricopeptide (TPR) repeat protein
VANNKEKLIAGAQKLVEKGQFDKAIKEYLKVVQLDDKDVRVWLKIGDLYAKLGKKPEATETYQRVAEFYSQQGFYLKAVAVYKQILKIDPRLVDVNQRLAELYKQLGLLSDAMEQYKQVATFFQSEGRIRDALAALKQIVELDPETIANRIKLAELYSQQQMIREAIDEFTKAAEQLKEARRTDEYMRVAERLLFLSPDNRPVSRELARLYIERADPRRALPKLQVCFKADPRDTEVLSLLARAFEALDQRAKSVSVLKELARILGENGDRRARDDVYRKILQLQPGDPDAEAALGLGQHAPSAGAAGMAAGGAPIPREPVPVPIPAIGSGRASSAPNAALAVGATGSRALVGDEFDRDMEAAPARPVVDRPTAGSDLPPEDEFDDEFSDRGTAQVPPAMIGGAPARGTPVGGMIAEAARAVVGQVDVAEQIARILNETDVYIKYRLYAKAIEHVQRVFELDGQHVEAREKLKALYLTIGKKDEALLELWALVEQAEPGRQRRYLREILELDPTDAEAAERLGTQPGVPVGDLGAVDDGGPGPSPGAARGEDDEEAQAVVEDDELLDVDEIELADDELIESHSAPIRVGAPVAAGEDDDLIPLVVAADKPAGDVEPLLPEEPEDRFGLSDDEVAAPSPVAAAPPPAFDGEPQAAEDDPELRTRFDDQAARMLAAGLLGGEEVDEADLPPPPSELPATRKVEAAAVTSPPALAPSGAVGSGSLEDDLDEADFFIQQSLFEEARAILEALLANHPGHPLVSAKLRDVMAMQAGATAEAGASSASAAPEEHEVDEAAVVEEGGSDGANAQAALADEPAAVVEETNLSAELPDELPGPPEPLPPKPGEPGGYELTRSRGVIEKGVTAEDYETHYDLGIAYKEMGLIDDAIAEFRLVMKDPTREVQCHLMIGLCQLEKGQITEAIGAFKKGLYVDGITDRETLSLYFELGAAYQRLGDSREALYYYEKVQKRDPRFRGIDALVEQLRAGAQAPGMSKPQPTDSDVDALFDGLAGGGDS